jgi:hypothetical protein
MLSWFNSLDDRKKVVDLSPYIRRICDLTLPNSLSAGEQGRVENRYNRTLPILVAPWKAARPDVERVFFATTRDLSDTGLSLVCTQSISGDVVVGFWLPQDGWSDPWFFLGSVLRSHPLGGGFWAAGIHLSEWANANYRARLQHLFAPAMRLQPE